MGVRVDLATLGTETAAQLDAREGCWPFHLCRCCAHTQTAVFIGVACAVFQLVLGARCSVMLYRSVTYRKVPDYKCRTHTT